MLLVVGEHAGEVPMVLALPMVLVLVLVLPMVQVLVLLVYR